MSATDLAVRRAPRWSTDAIARLRDADACPACGSSDIRYQRCGACGADYAGDVGAELWSASLAAAAALEARQTVLDRVPVTPAPAPAPAAAAVAASVALPAAEPPSSATVQSVLAVAGAGLVAIAAIVFTFFNPDLTDGVARTLITAGMTIAFLVGARVLARRGLQFSAEAVGALGLVFLGLDVSSLSGFAPPTISPWVFAALGTLVGAGIMAVLGVAVRIRIWVSVSLLALAFVPAMFGLAAPQAVTSIAAHVASAGAAFALIELILRIEDRFGAALRGERMALTVVQGVFFALVLLGLILEQDAFAATPVFVLLSLALLAALSARHPARGLWSFVSGATATAAIAILPLTLDAAIVPPEWIFALIPAGAVAGLVVFAALAPLPRSVDVTLLRRGALTVVGVSAVGPTTMAALVGASAVFSDLLAGAFGLASTAQVTAALAALAGGLGVFAVLTRTCWIGHAGEWFAVVAALTVVSSPELTLVARVAIGLGLAVAASAALVFAPRVRDAAAAARMPLIVGAHAAVALSALLSWRDADLVVWAGIGVVAATAALAFTVPVSVRFVHVGIGYAYALLAFAAELDLAGADSFALLCLTTCLGGVVAIVATFWARVPVRSWHAILVVTSVPFAIGVVQVVFERSAWTALSTGVIFLLALTLVVTRRTGLGIPIRALAAALLVPSLAVVAVCLGAVLLVTSGSPVVLPVVAALVAVVLPSTLVIRRALIPRIGERSADVARIAIESSTLLTAAIAVALSIAREAAGLSTTVVVLVILAIGAAATSLWAGRRYGWWLAGAALTGALWCVWGLMGVAVLEPYLLPPTLGAAIVGVVLTARGANAVPLYASALACAVLPILVLLAVVGTDAAAMPWRAYALVGAGWALVGFGALLGRGRGAQALRLRVLRTPTFAVAIAAGAAATVQAWRWSLGLDPHPAPTWTLVAVCLALGIAGAVPAALAGRSLRGDAEPPSRVARSRWLLAPALTFVAVAAWPAIAQDWPTIWTMWALMLAYLVVVVRVARRPGTTSLPPALFVFAIAFVTAIVAWSPRELRVEWFSLPLGLFLLAAGASALGAGKSDETDAAAGRTLADWPRRWSGSWALLGPGLVTLFSASMAATFTDPQTWRAILVIVLALVSILVGAGMKLAAPFLIGIVVLPLENALAFLVQIGRGIESMPWWVTLSVVGAVLLVIAVTYERRAGDDATVTARLRDLA